MTTVQGKIAFINHEKKYAIIEYQQSGKKKTVTGNIDVTHQKKLKEKRTIKKIHHFMMGDVVNCKIGISEKGDRMIATDIHFLYNTALDDLVNKSRSNNRFTGFLKVVDDLYFVKEIDSYLFFPVPFSPWQILPTEQELNEPVIFSLENAAKPEKLTASLLSNIYIPEFYIAVKHFKAKTILEAEIYRITPHGIYLNVINDKICAKISANKELGGVPDKFKMGDKIPIVITHLSNSRISVASVS
ncbi:MAG: hypothetical protein ABIP80_04235 [Ferruginibacter sp.]